MKIQGRHYLLILIMMAIRPVVATIAMIVFCENNGEGVFRIRGFPNAQYPFSMSASDYDLDGNLDLYVCIYGEGDSQSNSRGFGDRFLCLFIPLTMEGNVLIKNHGDFRFSDVTQKVGLNYQNNRWSFAASWEDLIGTEILTFASLMILVLLQCIEMMEVISLK